MSGVRDESGLACFKKGCFRSWVAPHRFSTSISKQQSNLKRKKTCQPSKYDGKRKKLEEGGQKGENEEEGKNVLEVKIARKQKGTGKKSAT